MNVCKDCYKLFSLMENKFDNFFIRLEKFEIKFFFDVKVIFEFLCIYNENVR